jgi:hypothetical protein
VGSIGAWRRQSNLDPPGDLYTEQSLLLTCMVLKHLQIPGQANTLLRIALVWSQLASGVGFPIMEFPDQTIPTLEDPFLQELRSGLSHLHASIRLHDNLVRPLSRQRVFYIMERLHASGNFSNADSLRVNYCRLYLGAYLASDNISPNGTMIHPSCFKGTLSQRFNTPSVRFPRQARPDKDSWVQWRRALRHLFTAPPEHHSPTAGSTRTMAPPPARLAQVVFLPGVRLPSGPIPRNRRDHPVSNQALRQVNPDVSKESRDSLTSPPAAECADKSSSRGPTTVGVAP